MGCAAAVDAAIDAIVGRGIGRLACNDILFRMSGDVLGREEMTDKDGVR